VLLLSAAALGSSGPRFVDLWTTQTVAGAKTWSNDATFSGDIILNGSNIYNTSSASGLNMSAASDANAGGEYGFVGGTNAILDGAGAVDLTVTYIGAFGEDLDGTPSYPWRFSAGGQLSVVPLALPSQGAADGLCPGVTAWNTQAGGATTRTDAAGVACLGADMNFDLGAGGASSGVNAAQNTGGKGGSWTATGGVGGEATNGTPNVGGAGGDTTLRAGDGAATNGAGGAIILDMGSGSGAGANGSLSVRLANSEVARVESDGDLQCDGDATIDGGDLSLGTGTAQTIKCNNVADCTLAFSNDTAAMNATIDGTFTATGTLTGSNVSGTNTGDASCTAANGLSCPSQVFAMAAASVSADGAVVTGAQSFQSNSSNAKTLSGNGSPTVLWMNTDNSGQGFGAIGAAGTPAAFALANFSTTEAAMYCLDGAGQSCHRAGHGKRDDIYAYHGVRVLGGMVGVQPAYANGGEGADPSLTVVAPATGLAQQWQDAASTSIAEMSSAGALQIDGALTATGTIAGSNVSSTFTGSASGSASGANTGDVTIATATSVFGQTSISGQALSTYSAIPGPLSARSFYAWQGSTTATGLAYSSQITGGSVTETGTASALTNVGTRGYSQRASAASNNALAGVESATMIHTYTNWRPRISALVRTDTAITTRRTWIGVEESTISLLAIRTAASGPAASAVDFAAIGFDTAVDPNWMLCTGDGTNYSCSDTGVAVAVSTEYSIVVDWRTSATTVTGWVNGTSVAKTSNVSTDSVALGFIILTTTLDATSRNSQISGFMLEQN